MPELSELEFAQTPEAPPVPEYFQWQYMQGKLRRFVDEWDNKFGNMAKVRRAMRAVDVDIDTMKQKGELKADEAFIPVRVIDSGINSEQPKFLQFVRGSRRLAIFLRDDGVEDAQVAKLEDDFTQGMKYVGWERWVLQTVDGAQLHGWNAVDIEFDTTKKLHVANNFIPFEDCILGSCTRDIQQQPYVVIRYPVTLSKLEEIAPAVGFNTDIIAAMREKYKEKETEEISIFKKYCKYQGIVYVSWFVLENDPIDWLREPQKLYLGIDKIVDKTVMQPQKIADPLTGQPTTIMAPVTVKEEVPADVTQYPVKVLQYRLTDDPQLLNSKGRAFLDEPSQAGQTALFTSFVNASVRSSNAYGSPANPQDTGGQIKKMPDLELEHGCFYDNPVNFWSFPAPSFDLVRAAQALQVQKQGESGQLATSVINRDDARKTKAEMDLAEGLSEEQASLPITNFSTFLQEIWSYDWEIVQNRATRIDPTTGKFLVSFCVDPATGQNNVELIARKYTLLAAGDTEVVKRAERLRTKIQLWPLVANTPLAMLFLVDILKEALPEEANKYEQFMNVASQAQQMLANLGPVLTEIGNGEPLTPDKLAMIKQLAQQITQLSAQSQSGAPQPTQ